MKRTSAILFTALATAFLSQPARADDKKESKDGAAAEAVRKADRGLTEAILKGDAKEFDRLTSDDYLLTGSSGRLWDKNKSLQALKEGSLTFEKIDDTDVKTRLYGDAAVVTGQSDMKGKSKERAFDSRYRWTRVFVLHDGAWKCAAEHLSRLATPDEPEKDKETPKDKDK